MSTIAKCKLDDGTICQYDAAGDRPDSYDPQVFKFIGEGVFYSLDGVRQAGRMRQCFFVYQERPASLQPLHPTHLGEWKRR